MFPRSARARSFEVVAAELSRAAAELSRHDDFPQKRGLVKFPRGVIKKKNPSRWSYLSAETADSLACMVLLIDVYDWHLRTWDLSLTAGSLFAWNAQVAVAMLLECLATEYCRQCLKDVKASIKFNASIEILRHRRIVSEEVAGALHAIRNDRNNVHLSKMGKIGSNDKDFQVFEDAKRTLHSLEAALREHAISIGVLVQDAKPAPQLPTAVERRPHEAFNVAAYVGEYFEDDEEEDDDEYSEEFYFSERERVDRFAEANFAVDGVYVDDLIEEDQDQYELGYEDAYPSLDS